MVRVLQNHVTLYQLVSFDSKVRNNLKIGKHDKIQLGEIMVRKARKQKLKMVSTLYVWKIYMFTC